MPSFVLSAAAMRDFAKLAFRLEAATARLEDIASSTVELPQGVPALQQTLASPQSVASLSSPPAPPPTVALPAVPKPPPEPVPEVIEEFDAFLQSSVGKYVKLSNQLGGLVAQQAAKIRQGFEAQRHFLLITTKAKKPDLTGSEMSLYQNLLKNINEALMAVTSIKEQNRGAPVFHHLSAVSEGAMVLAWVTVDNRPYKHVDESMGAAQFFGNRVLKEYKEKYGDHATVTTRLANSAPRDPQQVEWIQSFYQIFKDLSEYVQNNFKSGIPWNPKGLPAAEVARSLAASASATPTPTPASSGGGPPPPPPPPGPAPIIELKEKKAPAPSGGSDLGAVFSELNKGEAVTKGLRKVDKSEMTHKNPNLRAGATVPGRENSVRGKSPIPGKKPKPESMRVKKPPRKELEGNKWTIVSDDSPPNVPRWSPRRVPAPLTGIFIKKENFEKPSEPITIDAAISHSILISKCVNTTIIIRGKANAVTIENTSRLSLVVESLVSTVDAVKSQNFALQVMGAIPAVMLDQIDGAQIYFSKASIATKIFSSKSAGINLNVVEGDDEDDDFKEVPLPSQICSYFDEKKGELVNEIIDHAG